MIQLQPLSPNLHQYRRPSADNRTLPPLTWGRKPVRTRRERIRTEHKERIVAVIVSDTKEEIEHLQRRLSRGQGRQGAQKGYR